MWVKSTLTAGALCFSMIAVSDRVPVLAKEMQSPQPGPAAASGQAPPAAAPAQPPPARSGMIPHRAGGFVPGQKRPPGDPAQIARGKTLYDINCRACHGVDLRGGDLGGPNLLRSDVALTDQAGELIVPIIEGSRQKMGMPAIGISTDDAKAVAAFVRSVVGQIGVQGKPPGLGREAPSVLVGNASEGQAYFEVKCSSCHSPAGDLKGIATKVPDPRKLQTWWVAGGRGESVFTPGTPPGPRAVMVTVTLPSGERVEGQLVRADDFLVSIGLADGTIRTIRRDGSVPKVEIRDPMKAHIDLMEQYTDKDIHDVTAYLVTLK